MGEPNSDEWINLWLILANPPPKSNLLVCSRRDDVLTIGSKGHVELFAGGLAECVESQTGGCVPEL